MSESDSRWIRAKKTKKKIQHLLRFLFLMPPMAAITAKHFEGHAASFQKKFKRPRNCPGFCLAFLCGSTSVIGHFQPFQQMAGYRELGIVIRRGNLVQRKWNRKMPEWLLHCPRCARINSTIQFGAPARYRITPGFVFAVRETAPREETERHCANLKTIVQARPGPLTPTFCPSCLHSKVARNAANYVSVSPRAKAKSGPTPQPRQVQALQGTLNTYFVHLSIAVGIFPPLRDRRQKSCLSRWCYVLTSRLGFPQYCSSTCLGRPKAIALPGQESAHNHRTAAMSGDQMIGGR